MPSLLRTLFFAALGFVAGALVGSALISITSSNTHDLSLEATMTAIFVCGPVGAVVGVVVALVRRNKS